MGASKHTKTRLINSLTTVMLVALFFAMSHCYGLILSAVFPGVLVQSPWGIAESIIAVALMCSSLVFRFSPNSKAYKIRLNLFTSANYMRWLAALIVLIFAGVLMVAIMAELTVHSTGSRGALGDLNWGNYVNLLMWGLLMFLYNLVLRVKLNNKEAR